ncbi:bifunctional DNA primase/polymerase [Pseudonocardia sp. EC080619-01]|uniref:bifunctional DNA primase/polymerase n=1 Tax=Pseudonocardia sp. EC080619-01 TaxID=1096856 RepID=UPI0009EA6016
MTTPDPSGTESAPPSTDSAGVSGSPTTGRGLRLPGSATRRDATTHRKDETVHIRPTANRYCPPSPSCEPVHTPQDADHTSRPTSAPQVRHLQELRRAALDAAAGGRHVVEVSLYSTIPALHGERSCRPRGVCHAAHQHCEQRATRDPHQTRRLSSSTDCGVGIACSRAGLVVIEVDTTTAPDEDGATTGRQILTRVAAPGHDVTDTHAVTTSSVIDGTARDTPRCHQRAPWGALGLVASAPPTARQRRAATAATSPRTRPAGDPR